MADLVQNHVEPTIVILLHIYYFEDRDKCLVTIAHVADFSCSETGRSSFLVASAGLGRKIVQLAPKETFFSQGHLANSIFYLQKGRAKLTVVSKNGKEATITLLATGEFVGEESLATVGGQRMATATAITACTALKIEREEMMRVMHQEHAFSDLFVKFLLIRVCERRPISSISYSTQVRSAWHGFFF